MAGVAVTTTLRYRSLSHIVVVASAGNERCLVSAHCRRGLHLARWLWLVAQALAVLIAMMTPLVSLAALVMTDLHAGFIHCIMLGSRLCIHCGGHCHHCYEHQALHCHGLHNLLFFNCETFLFFSLRIRLRFRFLSESVIVIVNVIV